MEELLPLLIGVIWLAYTWYNKGQKNKQKPGARNTEEATPRKEPSILEQILMGQEIQMSDPEPEEVYETPEEFSEHRKVENEKSMGVTAPFLNTEIDEFSSEGQSTIPDNIEDIQVYLRSIERDDYSRYRVIDLRNFDLRKAVIYSAILNPPYIDYK